MFVGTATRLLRCVSATSVTRRIIVESSSRTLLRHNEQTNGRNKMLDFNLISLHSRSLLSRNCNRCKGLFNLLKHSENAKSSSIKITGATSSGAHCCMTFHGMRSQCILSIDQSHCVGSNNGVKIRCVCLHEKASCLAVAV